MTKGSLSVVELQFKLESSLPDTLRPEAGRLANIISKLLEQTDVAEEQEVTVSSKAIDTNTLNTLGDQGRSNTKSLLSLGANSQTGDVIVRDMAGNNIIHFNVYYEDSVKKKTKAIDNIENLITNDTRVLISFKNSDLWRLVQTSLQPLQDDLVDPELQEMLAWAQQRQQETTREQLDQDYKILLKYRHSNQWLEVKLGMHTIYQIDPFYPDSENLRKWSEKKYIRAKRSTDIVRAIAEAANEQDWEQVYHMISSLQQNYPEDSEIKTLVTETIRQYQGFLTAKRRFRETITNHTQSNENREFVELTATMTDTLIAVLNGIAGVVRKV